MDAFYMLGITFILIHEMDAIRCKEWRIFPGLSLLNDKNGRMAFIFLHIPLFYWVIQATVNGNDAFRVGFDYFLMIHFLLHLLMLKHKQNEFKDWLSWTIISGAGLFGFLDLLMTE